MKFIFLSLGVVFGLLVTANSGAQPLFTIPAAVLQLRIEIEKETEVLANAVLVHREDSARGVVLYFLTSETLMHPASVGQPASEPDGEGGNRGDDTTLSIAVIRLLIEKSELFPAAVTLDPPRQGAPFFIVGHTAAGERIVVPQHVEKTVARSAKGDLAMPWGVGCIGAPAFNEKGVFGILSDCKTGQPPTITLLSAARGLLRRLIPRLDLGPEGSQKFGIGH